MKIQILIIIALCFAIAACNKKEHEVSPTPQPIDTNINLVWSWHIDSVLYYTVFLNQKNNGGPFPIFNTIDSLKFYSSLNQGLSFTKYPENINKFLYNFNYESIIFIKDSPLTTIPLPRMETISHFWKQISNNKGFLTNLKMGDILSHYIDKDTLQFNIAHTTNEGVLITLDPFIEFIYDNNPCYPFDIESLYGYYIKIYLTRDK